MSKFTNNAIIGICLILALSSFLKFLADRDTKMMNYYDQQSTTVPVDKVAQGS